MNTFTKCALLALAVACVGALGTFGMRLIRSRRRFSKLC